MNPASMQFPEADGAGAGVVAAGAGAGVVAPGAGAGATGAVSAPSEATVKYAQASFFERCPTAHSAGFPHDGS